MTTRRQIATIGRIAIGIWQDQDARDTWLSVFQRGIASEIAAAESMTVADQKPHQVTPLFMRTITLVDGEDSAIECPPDQAEFVKVRACWWAE